MHEFHITTTSVYAEELSNQLSLLGAAAVTWQDAGDQPIYEPKPAEIIHWDEVKLIALFEEDSLLPAISHYLQRLQIEHQLSHFEVREVIEQDWVRLTREAFVPIQMGKRLWICPSWCEPADLGAINVLLDPGLAFGTGSHATTSLCLQWLDEHVQGNETVIDYGCGSGILAIAALKLGAQHVVAVDYDVQALEATQMNATLNQLQADQLQVVLPDQFASEPVDMIVANILATPLIELASRFATLIKPNGKIALSGILPSQSDEVAKAYAPWFIMNPAVVLDEWVRLDGVRR